MAAADWAEVGPERLPGLPALLYVSTTTSINTTTPFCLIYLALPPQSLSPNLTSSLLSVEEVTDTQLVCQTGSSNQTGGVPVRVLFGKAERLVPKVYFHYLDNPVITDAVPAESFYA